MKIKIKNIVIIFFILISIFGGVWVVKGQQKKKVSNSFPIIEIIDWKTIEEAIEDIKFEMSKEIVYTTTAVNMRTKPSMDGDIKEVIPLNTELTKVGEEDGWTKIWYEDEIYYIYSSYISKEKTIIQTYTVNIPAAASSNETSDGANVGYLTHYGPDCSGCSGVTAAGYNVSNTIYYNDSEYGQVRIVAMSRNYPLYSIIRINNYPSGPVIAIVLDRGGAIQGNKIDLLCSSEADTWNYGVLPNAQFEVLRYGG